MNMASLEFRLNFVTFALSVDILVSTKNSALGLKMCATTGGIKNYKSVINKKRTIKFFLNFIYKALIDSYVNHDKSFQ